MGVVNFDEIKRKELFVNFVNMSGTVIMTKL